MTQTVPGGRDSLRWLGDRVPGSLSWDARLECPDVWQGRMHRHSVAWRPQRPSERKPGKGGDFWSWVFWSASTYSFDLVLRFSWTEESNTSPVGLANHQSSSVRSDTVSSMMTSHFRLRRYACVEICRIMYKQYQWIFVHSKIPFDSFD